MAISLDVNDIKPLLSTFGLDKAPLKLGELPDSKVSNNVSNIPAPTIMPPTPASAGFTAFSSDPKNQQTIANSLTPAGQRIMPPNVPSSNTWNPSQSSIPSSVAAPAPWNPAQKDTPAIYAPASWVSPPTQDNPNVAANNVAPTDQPGLAPLNSVVTPPTSSSVAAPAATVPSPAVMQTQAQWEAANPKLVEKKMLSNRGWKGNLLNIATAGIVGAAGGLKGNPLAGINWVQQQAQDDQGVDSRNNANYRNAVVQPQLDQQARDQEAANVAYKQAQTKILPEAQQLKEDTLALNAKKVHESSVQQMLKAGYKEDISPEGTPLGTFSPDPESPFTRQREAGIAYKEAQTQSQKYDQELKAAQTELTKSKNDPNSPAYKLALAKLQVAQQNASAAGLRAETYKNMYLQRAYNIGADGQVLAGAPIITGEGGKESVVGTGNAPLAVKQQNKVVTFNDLKGSYSNLRTAMKDYESSGGDMSDARLTAAASDPESTIGKIINGKLITNGLSDKAITLLNAQRQAQEQAGILRATTGGTNAEAGAQRILETIPKFGQDTNKSAYNKLDEGDIVLRRLAPGQTRVAGGITVKTNEPAKGKTNYASPPAQSTPQSNQSSNSGMGVSLQAARGLSQFKGKSDAVITKAIKDQGHTVLP